MYVDPEPVVKNNSYGKVGNQADSNNGKITPAPAYEQHEQQQYDNCQSRTIKYFRGLFFEPFRCIVRKYQREVAREARSQFFYLLFYLVGYFNLVGPFYSEYIKIYCVKAVYAEISRRPLFFQAWSSQVGKPHQPTLFIGDDDAVPVERITGLPVEREEEVRRIVCLHVFGTAQLIVKTVFRNGLLNVGHLQFQCLHPCRVVQ